MGVLPGGARAALGLLTRLPVRGASAVPVVRGGPWYPGVGALVGAVVALVLLGAGAVLPALVAGLLAVTAEVLLTGALHLDGLADCADGAAGGDPEHRLRIMSDHAVGVYGTAAVVLDLALRAACLGGVADLVNDGRVSAVAATGLLVAAWAISRTAILVPARLLSYPRAEGTGRDLIEGLGTRAGVTGLAVGATLALMGGTLGGASGLLAVLAGLGLAGFATALTTRWAARRLGGATGDVLGCVAEVALVCVLVGALAVLTAPGR